jgi:hypothetical protein
MANIRGKDWEEYIHTHHGQPSRLLAVGSLYIFGSAKVWPGDSDFGSGGGGGGEEEEKGDSEEEEEEVEDEEDEEEEEERRRRQGDTGDRRGGKKQKRAGDAWVHTRRRPAPAPKHRKTAKPKAQEAQEQTRQNKVSGVG